MNIDDIQEYMSKCPYLEEEAFINVDYLSDKIKSYSVCEVPSYDPVLKSDIVGNEYCQFQYYFDIKLSWNEEIQNNINNSKLFKNISDWLKDNNNKKIHPKCDDNCFIKKLKPSSNGYILLNGEDEAIYRIACRIEYWRKK